jgi:hypothetical protein
MNEGLELVAEQHTAHNANTERDGFSLASLTSKCSTWSGSCDGECAVSSSMCVLVADDDAVRT